MPDHPTTPLAPARPVPGAGVVRLRVRYCECDPMGVVHHAAYAPWLEVGRTEALRECGVSYADMERAGIFLVVARMQFNFRRPVLYDDLVEVRTRVSGGSRVKIEHAYEIVVVERAGRADNAGLPATEASTTLVCVGRDGRPRALPEWLTAESHAQSGPTPVARSPDPPS